jgi:hypothetical protein
MDRQKITLIDSGSCDARNPSAPSESFPPALSSIKSGLNIIANCHSHWGIQILLDSSSDGGGGVSWLKGKGGFKGGAKGAMPPPKMLKVTVRQVYDEACLPP